jgi:hypothetical protein
MLHMDDALSDNQRSENRQSIDGLGQSNPSPTKEIVRRGQEALDRKRRSFDDWLLIGGALEIGRIEVMRAANTNLATGKRYERQMAEWLHARGFHLIDKCTRSHLSDCLKHRAETAEWLAPKTEGERFKLNHPTTVLRKWRASTVVPNPNAPKRPSPMAKLQDSLAHLEEENHRMRKEIERGGGDLWTPEDRPEDIGDIWLAKLSESKAEKTARYVLARIKERRANRATAKPAAPTAAASADNAQEALDIKFGE